MVQLAMGNTFYKGPPHPALTPPCEVLVPRQHDQRTPTAPSPCHDVQPSPDAPVPSRARCTDPAAGEGLSTTGR
eukprot:scaffold24553_cov48-Phaeocystis_antarctica.AAC.2